MTNKTFLIIALLSIAQWAIGQSQWQVVDAQMQIHGTSTLHDWTSNVNEVKGTATIEYANKELKAIKDVDITVAVKSIDSGKGSVMDNNTYNALMAEKYPNIEYTLTKVNAITKENSIYKVSTTGKLTIAGTTKAIDMDVQATVLPDGKLQFEGSKKIDMTTFDVEPPTALLGTIKTGKEVEISFKTTLSQDVN